MFDHVGSDTFKDSLRCLAKGGRYVFCGSTSGFDLAADFRPIFFKNISILGSTMGSLGELRQVRDLMEDGRLQPVVDRVLPLEKVQEAHAVLEERRAFGKVVLSIELPSILSSSMLHASSQVNRNGETLKSRSRTSTSGSWPSSQIAFTEPRTDQYPGTKIRYQLR